MRNPDIWLPGMSTKPKIAHCGCCGKEFFEGEYRVAMRHMKHCSDERIEEMTAELPSRRLPGIFGDEARDHELEEFISRNRDKVARGHRIRL